jgi:hypothetical protein
MGSSRGNLGLFRVITALGGSNRPHGMHRCPGILEFLPTLEADAVGSFLDGEHATDLSVMAPKRGMQNPEQWFHKSCARRRSQLPLASSHSSKERRLARARAMEQSAAP